MQGVGAVMLLCGIAASIPTVLELLWILCFPGGGFMAGLISDLGRGKAHRPPSILPLSCWCALCRDSGTSQYRESMGHPDPFHSDWGGVSDPKCLSPGLLLS